MQSISFTKNLSREFLILFLTAVAFFVGTARGQAYSDPNAANLEEFRVQGDILT